MARRIPFWHGNDAYSYGDRTLMQRIMCTFCNSDQARGFLFGSLKLRICRRCRDEVLTYLNSIGITMTEANPFIAELCIESHLIEDAWWTYYDSINQDKGKVEKLIHPRNREGLREVLCAFTKLPFYMVDDS